MSARERHLDQVAAGLRRTLIERRRAAAAGGSPAADEVSGAVHDLVEREAAILSAADREELAERILRDTVGLGPLEELLADPEVEEVMVNGPGSVYVERRGRIEATAISFADEEELRNAIERILAPLGRRVDELSPMVDARLADGSRVNVVIPPLAIDGPALSIRRFGASRPGPDGWSSWARWSPRCGICSRWRSRSAAASSSAAAPARARRRCSTRSRASSIGGERVVTIEDAAELRLQQPHVVRLESRPASVEGRGEVTIRDLLRNALRMRPDRIVIGEVRGAEALDLLTALNTGHDGALSTVHANSPADALRRLETLALMAGVGLPHDAIAEQVQRGDRPRRPHRAAHRRLAAGGRDRRGGSCRRGDGRSHDCHGGGRRLSAASGALAPLLGAVAGGLVAVAAREAVLATRRPSPPGCAGAGAAAAGGPRGLRALDAGAAPAGPRSERRGGRRRLVRRRARRWPCRWRSPAPLPRPGRSRAAAGATGPRSSARCPTSPSRSPTR